MKKVFYGPSDRVQIKINDLSGPEVPEMIRQEKPTFVLRCLHNDAPKHTKFVAGDSLYNGDDIERVKRVMEKFVPGSTEDVIAFIKKGTK